MKAARKTTLLSLAVLCCLIVFGCGKEDGGTTTPKPGGPTPPGDAEVGKMDVEQLRASALKCRTALLEKSAEAEKKASELIKTMTSDDAAKREKLNAEIGELKKETEALGKQLEVYIAKIKEKGGDVSDLVIGE